MPRRWPQVRLDMDPDRHVPLECRDAPPVREEAPEPTRTCGYVRVWHKPSTGRWVAACADCRWSWSYADETTARRVAAGHVDKKQVA